MTALPIDKPPIIYPPEKYYLQDQIILTGPRSILEKLDANPDVGILPIHDRELTISGLGQNVLGCLNLPNGSNLVIRLYKILSGTPVAEVLLAVRNALGPDSEDVTAEPNWIIGQPYEVEGSPYEVEGSPANPTALVTALATEMESQWGMRIIGHQRNATWLAACKDEMQVVVFDTAPLPDGTITSLRPTPQPIILQSQAIPSLTVVARSLTNDVLDNQNNMRNHGFFVSGLIHEIAPHCKLKLVRVLNDLCEGNLFDLIEAIFDHLSEISSLGEYPPQVFNLSLAVRIPLAEAQFGLPVDLLALQYILSAARCFGVVVVAAAGNSSGKRQVPLPPSAPASLASVVGVAGVNRYCERSCFSNAGDLAAPAGDRRSTQDQVPCDCFDPDAGNRYDAGNLVGPLFAPITATGYTYWSGTSFAAPLASGLAALIFQCNPQLTPAEVEHILHCTAVLTQDASLGSGIICIPAAIALATNWQTPGNPCGCQSSGEQVNAPEQEMGIEG